MRAIQGHTIGQGITGAFVLTYPYIGGNITFYIYMALHNMIGGMSGDIWHIQLIRVLIILYYDDLTGGKAACIAYTPPQCLLTFSKCRTAC